MRDLNAAGVRQLAHEEAIRSDNRFTLLVGARAFMDDLARTLQAPHTSLYAQFMTYEGDATGQEFAALLTHQAGQGADVRLMVDAYSDVVLSDVWPVLIHRRGEVAAERARTHALFDRLRAQGVQVKRTAPLGTLGRFALYRDHKKMVVIDEQIAFVGGINISDHNYDWHDFMVKIEGPLARVLAHDFRATWDGQCAPLSTPCPGEDFVLNQCPGRYPILEHILRMIARAQRSIVIESPYLLGDHLERALRAAAERGVRVTLILPARSNKLLYRRWVRMLRRRLNHPNVTVYGHLGGSGMTHAKLILVDDQWASFGSFNMIELEGLTQKELNVFSSNAALIAQFQDLIAGDIAHAVPVPAPRVVFGRPLYAVLYRFFRWWTRRLLRDADWKARYC